MSRSRILLSVFVVLIFSGAFLLRQKSDPRPHRSVRQMESPEPADRSLQAGTVPPRTTAPGSCDEPLRKALSRISGTLVALPDRADSPGKFCLRDRNVSIFFTRGGWTLGARWHQGISEEGAPIGPSSLAIRSEFVGARLVDPEGEGETETSVRYYQPEGASEILKGYSVIAYRDVWPGVDIVYEPRSGGMEYTILVKPGGRVESVRLAYLGAETSLDESGNLILATPRGDLRESPPVTCQGHQSISSRFRRNEDGTCGFEVGPYDTHETLIIDPTLAYGTYVGGTGVAEAYGVIVDAAGNAFVAGWADSTYPKTVGPSFGGGTYDSFLTKVDAAGSGLLWSTYIGGSGNDYVNAVAIDSSGNPYITGQTYSSNFPKTVGPSFGASTSDAFVAKFDGATGAVIWARLLGDTGTNFSRAIAVDGSGNVFITGGTSSSSFPTTPGAFKTTYTPGGTSGYDGFVSKLDSTGSTILWSSYLGGTGDDVGHGIAVDGAGNAHVTGRTSSADFPTTPGAYKTFYGGGTEDAFVAAFNSSGSALLYSSFLGGSGDDNGRGIAVDGAGNAYVLGHTNSADLGTTAGVFQPTLAGGYDMFVAKVNPTGTELAWCSYLGGPGEEYYTPTGIWAAGIAVDGAGNVFVAGTTSGGFPTVGGPYLAFKGGNSDAFATKIDSAGATLLWSTYLGGSGDEIGTSIAIGSSGDVYVAGATTSTDFPTSAGAYQTSLPGGAVGVFVVRLGNTGSGGGGGGGNPSDGTVSGSGDDMWWHRQWWCFGAVAGAPFTSGSLWCWVLTGLGILFLS